MEGLGIEGIVPTYISQVCSEIVWKCFINWEALCKYTVALCEVGPLIRPVLPCFQKWEKPGFCFWSTVSAYRKEYLDCFQALLQNSGMLASSVLELLDMKCVVPLSLRKGGGCIQTNRSSTWVSEPRLMGWTLQLLGHVIYEWPSKMKVCTVLGAMGYPISKEFFFFIEF